MLCKADILIPLCHMPMKRQNVCRRNMNETYSGGTRLYLFMIFFNVSLNGIFASDIFLATL